MLFPLPGGPETQVIGFFLQSSICWKSLFLRTTSLGKGGLILAIAVYLNAVDFLTPYLTPTRKEPNNSFVLPGLFGSSLYLS